MIKYALKCSQDHIFDVWFSKGSDFEVQAPKGLISCPECGVTQVEKAIMSPAISKSTRLKGGGDALDLKASRLGARKAFNPIGESRKIDESAEMGRHAKIDDEKIERIAAKIRAEIGKKCEDVGDKFADEARAIHYGEKEQRPIYGSATPKQAQALNEEGVNIAPLPDILVPKSKTKLN